MSVFEYTGNLTKLDERGAIHTIAEQAPGRGGEMRPEWRDEQDGFAVTLTLFSPDGDEASVRLTADRGVQDRARPDARLLACAVREWMMSDERLLSGEHLELALNRVAGPQRGVALEAHRFVLAHEDARKEQVRMLREALVFVLHHSPCPCGAWQDRLPERPHAPGCHVELALEVTRDA